MDAASSRGAARGAAGAAAAILVLDAAKLYDLCAWPDDDVQPQHGIRPSAYATSTRCVQALTMTLTMVWCACLSFLLTVAEALRGVEKVHI